VRHCRMCPRQAELANASPTGVLLKGELSTSALPLSELLGGVSHKQASS
jgi:hypothetical protein